MSKNTHERTKVKIIKHKTLFDKIKALLVKYRDVIAYLFFGVLTTVINILTYAFCAHVLHINTLASTAIGQIVAIIAAYLTNRKWVFHSEAHTAKAIIREILSFIGARAATFFLDMLIMFIFVDKLHWPDIPVKIASNILVIVLNYVASKLFIFVKPKKQ